MRRRRLQRLEDRCCLDAQRLHEDQTRASAGAPIVIQHPSLDQEVGAVERFCKVGDPVCWYFCWYPRTLILEKDAKSIG
jgi:hypothetical protein